MILLIDTATTQAHVSLSLDGKLLAGKTSGEQKEHAAFVQPAIAALLTEQGIGWESIKAVAVSNGPGSYTGLRVGLATAKGICFAKQIPLICLSTLELMAGQWRMNYIHEENSPFFIAPMIDARRMEVFTAVYNSEGKEVNAPHALILTPESYMPWLELGMVHFIGDGSDKWKNSCTHPHAKFPQNQQETANFMAEAANSAFLLRNFNDLAYAEPFYIKEFHTTAAVKR